MFSLIVACDQQYAIGRQNTLPWRMRDDLAFFMNKTRGGAVWMGRKTAESLPKLLPDRDHYVLTRQANLSIPGMTVVSDIDVYSTYEAIQQQRRDEGQREIYHWCIGGAEIYRWMLKNNWVSEMYITHIRTSIDQADAFFPFDEMIKTTWKKEWVQSIEKNDKNQYPAEIWHWRREGPRRPLGPERAVS